MYLLRMVEALESDFRRSLTFSDADGFADLVTRYVPPHPSRQLHVQPAGRPISGVHAKDPASAGRGFLADLARLELLVTEVFDAPKSPAWPAEESGRIPRAAWAAAPSSPSPPSSGSLRSHRVNAYLQSVKDETTIIRDTGRRRHLDRRFCARTTRSGGSTSTSPSTDFSPSLAKGRPFGKAVARAASGGGDLPRSGSRGGCGTGSPRGCSPDSPLRPEARPFRSAL